MKKFLLPVICAFLILFTGCAQLPDSSNSSNGLKVPSKTEAQTNERGESTANTLSPSSEDSSKTEAVNGNQNTTSTLKSKTGAKVVQIKEKMFIQQCDDIYTNPEDYKDKIIKLEGMYDEFTDTDTGKTYHIIYRQTPGCCGADGQTGFEFDYNGKMPRPNDWIKVTGTIEVVKDSDGYENIILHLTELEVSDKRGAEFVAY